MSMRPCLFTGIFRDHPLERCVEAAAAIGYPDIELQTMSHLPPDSTEADRAAVRDLIRGHGLSVAAVYTPTGRYSTRQSDEERQEQLLQLGRYAEWAAELGAPYVTHFPGGPASHLATDEHWTVAATWMQRAADAAAQAGVKVIMEMHHNELTDSVEGSLRLLKMVGRDNLGLIYDPGNLFIAGSDFGPDAIRRLFPVLWHVHVKDLRHLREGEEATGLAGNYQGKRFPQELLGEGEVDHGPLFATLAELGYEGDLSCEARVSGDPTEIAKHEFWEVTRLCADQRRPAQPRD